MLDWNPMNDALNSFYSDLATIDPNKGKQQQEENQANLEAAQNCLPDSSVISSQGKNCKIQ